MHILANLFVLKKKIANLFFWPAVSGTGFGSCAISIVVGFKPDLSPTSLLRVFFVAARVAAVAD